MRRHLTRHGPLGLLLLLALVLRLGHAANTSGFNWDVGSYLPLLDDPGLALRGEVPSLFGRERPKVVPLGLPLLVSGLNRLTGVGVRSANQLVTLVSGLALVLLVYALGRRLGGRTCGWVAALLITLEPRAIEFSVAGFTETPFEACALLGLLLLMTPRPTFGHVAGAALALSCAVWLRTLGVAYLPFAAALLVVQTRRGALRPRDLGLGLGLLTILVAIPLMVQREAELRNAAFPGADEVRMTLYLRGEFPQATWPDSTGATLLLASEETQTGALVTASRALDLCLDHGVQVGVVLGPLLLLAFLSLVSGPRPRRRRDAWVLCFALAPVAAVIAALGAPSTASRYYWPALPVLLVLASRGGFVALEWLLTRRRPSLSARQVRGVALGVAALLGGALWMPSEAMWGLVRHAQGVSVRQQVDAIAAGLAQELSPGDRVARGPGGLPDLPCLAGAYQVWSATGPDPSAIEAYLRLNEVRWIVYAREEAGVTRGLLEGARLEERYEWSTGRGGAQVLARIRYPS